MKNIFQRLLIILVTLLLCNLAASAQIFNWAKSIGGNVTSNGIAVDANGGSYITGWFLGTATFGNIQLSTKYNYINFFVAKYDAGGNVLWAKQAQQDTNSYSVGEGVSVDANGNTYISGKLLGVVNFGNIKLTATNSLQDIFVAKFDPSGNCLWAEQAGDSITSNGITVDANGNSYVIGNFQKSATFGSFQLTSGDSGNVFIAKYDINGNFIWAKKNNGDKHSWAEGFGISIDANNNIYGSGQFYDNVSFGNIQLTASGTNSNIFIVKYDVNGNCIWANQSNGSGYYDNAQVISTDAYGNSYIAGQFNDTVTLGNSQMISKAHRNAFVAKYDANGNCIWASQVKSAFSNSTGISLDRKGNSYITGQFGDTATFGNIQLDAGDSSNFFIAKYDGNGSCLWAKQSAIIDSNSIAGGLRIASDTNGNSYITGSFTGLLTIGNDIITGGDFIAKISNTVLGITTEKPTIPNYFNISQNYPNPFNPTTVINYSVPRSNMVTIRVYDILGNETATLVNEEKPAGSYSINFNASRLSSGVYFYRMQAGSFVETKKLILMK